MAIRGSLREASLPDVVQLLAMGQKSGCLAVTDGAGLGCIFFERGVVCHATIVNRRDRLGDLLVRAGQVEPDALAAALEAQAGRDRRRVGEILAERGAVSREVVERYVRLQIEEAVYALFGWTRGTFHFDPERRPEPGDLRVALDAEGLLLEGARRVDEWSQIEKKIPTLDLVFGLTADRAQLHGAQLGAEQRALLPLVDGRRSVHDLVDATGMVEFQVGKALFGLIQAGFLHPRGRKPRREVEVGARDRVRERLNLGVAFLRIGMLEDALRELRALVETAPGCLEGHFHLGVAELRAGSPRAAALRLMELVKRGGRWGAAFHNLAVALERLGRVEDALLAAAEARSLLPDAPETRLLHAVLLCKTGRMAEAAESFRRYRAAVGEAARLPVAYFAFAMPAEGACGRLDAALRLAEEGEAAHPGEAVVLLHAAQVRERAGAAEEAELLYRRAVERDPRLAPALRSLGDLLARRGAAEEALQCYRRAASLSPTPGAELLCRMGTLRYRQGERAEAVRLWRDALVHDPDHVTARTNLELVQQALVHVER